MVLFKLQVKIPYPKHEEVIDLFNRFVGPTSAFSGCVDMGLYTNLNSSEMVLLEEWRSQEDLEQYIRSEEFKKILAVMDLAVEQPDVHVYLATDVRGIEWLRELRVD